ncbi:hypothetical protein BRADI_3g60992v3 [Brachypodium distachyon]|uniref:non-specific serine/threonine protein kinase n=1 Tax=Brachypodium distachyon TaxID=15368 RepID=A0A0Q3FRW5_BRADI|nr:hypothetical protein BRADI_3g60992v3 [Brachypodium distachyon]
MDGTTVRAIVLRSPRAQPFSFDGWSFAEGFFCASLCDVFLFSVFIVSTDSGGWFYDMSTGQQVIWLANQASPVRENATLELTRNGNLILRDVVGIMGGWFGLVSFDHPTDSLVPMQSLLQENKKVKKVENKV